MKSTFKKIFDFLYAPFFAVLDFFMRNYRANRDRLQALLRMKKVSTFLQYLAMLVLILWMLIYAFSSEESRNRLTEEVRKSFSGLKTFTE